jgi:hypothetical protein
VAYCRQALANRQLWRRLEVSPKQPESDAKSLTPVKVVTQDGGMRRALAFLSVAVLLGCTTAPITDAGPDSGGPDASCPQAPTPIACTADGTVCPDLTIAGESPAGPGSLAGTLDIVSGSPGTVRSSYQLRMTATP